MKKTALLTLGRLPKALDVAHALHGAGWRVIIAEPSKWHLSRVSRSVSKCVPVTAPNDNQARYLADLLAIIEDEGVSLVVPISEEALHVTLIDRLLPEGVALYSMPHEHIRQLHDKKKFIALAASFGLPVPETHQLGSDEATCLAMRGAYIIKPICTCSGQGLEICERGTSLPQLEARPPSVVQAFLDGAHKSSFSIAHKGRIIGTVVYRARILSGTVAVAFERLNQETAIENWIAIFAEKSNHSGFISFDFIEDAAGSPLAIECNPRATSGIHFVEPDDLANAILNPAQQFELKTKPFPTMQQFYPCLTETQVAAFKGNQFRDKLQVLMRSKDVSFSWRDPLPLWLMPFTAWSIIKRSMAKNESFGEASTHDIAWFE
ncbi:MAG: ATP-grasp domain-containing protein [Pseudomonadota bacterium]